MKFSLSWLLHHLDTSLSLSALEARLTAIGMEVETLVDRRLTLKDFSAARIVRVSPHPEADRLQVCQLETRVGPVQVVCGAPNVSAGQMGVFAPAGVTIPGTGMRLKRSRIRGVESAGMLCSERELQISPRHDEIIELAEECPIGQAAAIALGLDDPTFDLAITPNRGDCLGVRGIARDLMAAGAGELRAEGSGRMTAGTYPSPVSVMLSETEDLRDRIKPTCPLFCMRLIRNLHNGPSPRWLQERIHSAGGTPINLLVDVTNYLLYDRARPMHAYDRDQVQGNLVVRRAREGEKFSALDGTDHTLNPADCVIADDTEVLGLGGIMGGARAACSLETRNVLLESAWFEPEAIARSRRHHGIESEAAFRFERMVDPASALTGLDIATRILLEIGGGEASEVVIAGTTPGTDVAIDLPLSEVERLSGLVVEPPAIRHFLTRLGCMVSSGTSTKTLRVSPPSWRPDLQQKADLVEEIVRLVGVDRIASVPLPAGSSRTCTRPAPTATTTKSARVRRQLASLGLVEATCWSFIPENLATRFGGSASMTLANPISVEMAAMRPALLPGLLMAASRNRRHAVESLGLFELGSVFRGFAEGDQLLHVAAVRTGGYNLASGGARHWRHRPLPDDSLWAAKSDALSALHAIGMAPEAPSIDRDVPPWFHPGRSGRLHLGPHTLGHFGELHPREVRAFELTGPVAIFEINVSAIPARFGAKTHSKAGWRTPTLLPVTRDVAFLVTSDTPAISILSAIRRAGRPNVTDVQLFDIYQSKEWEQNLRSLAFAITLQPKSMTFRDHEIDAIIARIVSAVTTRFDARLRDDSGDPNGEAGQT